MSSEETPTPMSEVQRIAEKMVEAVAGDTPGHMKVVALVMDGDAGRAGLAAIGYEEGEDGWIVLDLLQAAQRMGVATDVGVSIIPAPARGAQG